MNERDVNVELKYITFYEYRHEGNRFTNLPDSLGALLHEFDGLMTHIVNEMYPDQLYEIKLSIKTV